MAEFGIHAIDHNTPGIVTGRCYKGPLRVGEEFTSFVDEAGTAHLVRLKVARIEAYSRDLDEIDEGLTARLTLHGNGADLLRDRAILHGP